MQKTTNYELNKPEAADQYNIEHFNDNADTIDAQMKANADAISSLDSATMKKANNLSDLENKSTAMTNVIDSYTAATDANVNSDNIEVMTRKVETGNAITWYKTKFSSFWNYIKGKAASWFGITVTESEGSITGRVFNGDVSGGVETAAKLSNIRHINGMAFDGSQDVACYCDNYYLSGGVYEVFTYQSSSQSTEYPFSVVRGARISVKFQYPSTSAGSNEIKLSVNNSDAVKVVLSDGSSPDSTMKSRLWKIDEVVDFVYNGTYWCIQKEFGTEVTLNGSNKKGTTASFYAPTSAGTSGYVLISNGSGSPSWSQLCSVKETVSLPLRNAGYFSSPFNGYQCYGTILSDYSKYNGRLCRLVLFFNQTDLGTNWRFVTPIFKIDASTLTYGYRTTFTYMSGGVYANAENRYFSVIIKRVNNTLYVICWDRSYDSPLLNTGATISMEVLS